MSDSGGFEVYKSIASITGELAKVGISKDRKNQTQGYSFRGIDDVYAALSVLLAENQLCIIPYVETRECVERESQRGGILFYVTIACRFDMVSAKDGSIHSARAYGEAMDSADKATNKAMSAAYKYMALQVFCIPVEGQDNDADLHTHEIAAARGVQPGTRQAAKEVGRQRIEEEKQRAAQGQAKPAVTVATPKLSGSPAPNAIAQMVESFQPFKTMLGEKTYRALLELYGVSSSNQFRPGTQPAEECWLEMRNRATDLGYTYDKASKTWLDPENLLKD